MSRFADCDEDLDPLTEGRRMRNIKVCVEGKRGQAALRRLEEALLALPQPRLIRDHLATAEGDVCTVGAYMAFRDGPEHLEERITELAVADALAQEDYADMMEITLSEGERQAVGLTATLVWILGDLNDEICYHETPEGRYERVLAWVRRHLR